MKILRSFLVLGLIGAASYSFADGSNSQQGGGAPSPSMFGLGLNFGSIMINGTNYNSIRLQPDVDLSAFNIPFGIGLDLNLEFDANLNVRVSEWNSWQAILSKILYIRWGKKGDPIFAKLGSMDDFLLGNGTIMNHYNNMLNYPAMKKIGFAFDLDFGYAGFETVVNNIFLFDIMGLRAYGRPLKDTKILIADTFEVGVTVSADIDPLVPTPPDSNSYSFTHSFAAPAVIVWGVDASVIPLNIPLLAQMKTYIDYASISGKGSGIMVGAVGSLITFIPYRFELRYLMPKFVPAYFDVYYEATRSTKYASLDALTNMYFGFLFSSGVSLLDNKIVALLQIEDYDLFSAQVYPDLTFNLVVDKEALFKKVSLKAGWTRKNIKQFADVFNYESTNSILSAEIEYFISDNLAISLIYKRTFSVGSDGVIQPFTSTSINTQLSF